MRSAGLEIWKAQVCYSEKLQRGGSLTSSRWFAVLFWWHFSYARMRSWSLRFGYKYKEKTMIAYVITSLYCKFQGNNFKCFSRECYPSMSYWNGRINLPLRTCCRQDKYTINPSCVGAISGTVGLQITQSFNVTQKTDCSHECIVPSHPNWSTSVVSYSLVLVRYYLSEDVKYIGLCTLINEIRWWVPRWVVECL